MNVPSTIFLGNYLLASVFGVVTKCVTLIFKKVLFGQTAIVSVKRWIYHFLFHLPLFLSLPRTEGFETELLLIPALGMGAYCTVHTVHILNYFHSWASPLNVG